MTPHPDLEKVHPKPAEKWPPQYNWKGDYVCQKPVSLGWALLIIGPLYLAAWCWL